MGVKFAGLLDQFREIYSNEDLFAMLEQQKWPAGFRCSECSHSFSFKILTRNLPLYECRKCGFQESLTSRTIMHKSRTPLWKWMFVFYLMGHPDGGIQALQLSSLIQVTYKTAWSMLLKVRSSLEQSNLISSAVEVEIKHEVYRHQLFPTEDRLQRERSVSVVRAKTEEQVVYQINVVERKKQARNIWSATEQEQVLRTLGLVGHSKVTMKPRYQQSRRSLTTTNTGADQVQDANVPTLSEIANQAFSWINDTYHGLGMKYARHYFNEYCFRMNARNKAIQDPLGTVLQFAILHGHGQIVSNARRCFDERLSVIA